MDAWMRVPATCSHRKAREQKLEIFTLERTPAWTQGAAPYALPTNAVQAMRLPAHKTNSRGRDQSY
jgi:hypothetical protein